MNTITQFHTQIFITQIITYFYRNDKNFIKYILIKFQKVILRDLQLFNSATTNSG